MITCTRILKSGKRCERLLTARIDDEFSVWYSCRYHRFVHPAGLPTDVYELKELLNSIIRGELGINP